MANNTNDPWYNWLNPAYGYSKYYDAAQNGTGVANRISRTAGALGGYDLPELGNSIGNVIENPGNKGNWGNLGLDAATVAWDATLGKAALAGKLGLKSGSVLGKQVMKTVPGQTFLRTLTGLNPLKGTQGSQTARRVAGNVFGGGFTALTLPGIFSDVANAVTGKSPKMTTYSNVTSNMPKSPTYQADLALKNSGIGSDAFWQAYKTANPKGAAEMVNQFDKENGIGSANFNAAYAQANPKGALEQSLMGLTNPMIDLQKRTALREADTEFQRVKNMLEGAQEGLNTQYAANTRDTNQQTTGSTLDQRAQLASLGQQNTGLVGLGAQSIATEGNRALAQLAAAKSKQDQNIVDAQSNADITRKERRKNAIQAWGAATDEYKNQLMREMGIL